MYHNLHVYRKVIKGNLFTTKLHTVIFVIFFKEDDSFYPTSISMTTHCTIYPFKSMTYMPNIRTAFYKFRAIKNEFIL